MKSVLKKFCVILPKTCHGAFVSIGQLCLFEMFRQKSGVLLHVSLCECDFGTSPNSPPENKMITERVMSGQRRSKRLNSSGNMTAWLKNETNPIATFCRREK